MRNIYTASRCSEGQKKNPSWGLCFMSGTTKAKDLPFWLTVLGRKNKHISKENLYFFSVHSSSVTRQPSSFQIKQKPSCWDGGCEPHLLSEDTQGHSCCCFISKQGLIIVKLHKYKDVIILPAKKTTCTNSVHMRNAIISICCISFIYI